MPEIRTLQQVTVAGRMWEVPHVAFREETLNSLKRSSNKSLPRHPSAGDAEVEERRRSVAATPGITRKDEPLRPRSFCWTFVKMCRKENADAARTTKAASSRSLPQSNPYRILAAVAQSPCHFLAGHSLIGECRPGRCPRIPLTALIGYRPISPHRMGLSIPPLCFKNPLC